MRTGKKSTCRNGHPSEVDLQQEFLKSNDLHFAALAIGRHPNNAPAWAVRACREAWVRCEIAVQAPPRGRKPYKDDPTDLEKMAMLLIEEKCKTPWEAAGVVGGHPSNQRRLYRYWKRDYCQFGPDQGHLRLNRAAKKLAEKKGIRPLWT